MTAMEWAIITVVFLLCGAFLVWLMSGPPQSSPSITDRDEDPSTREAHRKLMRDRVAASAAASAAAGGAKLPSDSWRIQIISDVAKLKEHADKNATKLADCLAVVRELNAGNTLNPEFIKASNALSARLSTRVDALELDQGTAYARTSTAVRDMLKEAGMDSVSVTLGDLIRLTEQQKHEISALREQITYAGQRIALIEDSGFIREPAVSAQAHTRMTPQEAQTIVSQALKDHRTVSINVGPREARLTLRVPAVGKRAEPGA